VIFRQRNYFPKRRGRKKRVASEETPSESGS
jgi:hypothetical protein